MEYDISWEVITQAVWHRDALLGTDGSVLDEHGGMYGVALLIQLDNDESMLAAAFGRHMPNIAEYLNMDSHHCKATALYAALIFLQSLLHQFPQTNDDNFNDLPPKL